ncbi:MAG: hypothetical protein L0Y67_01270 [Gammaproteobacteria bacterium]|nr:hypothetical protein [Gammaproteobacteria bacterium]MCI0590234.1 hypothetical protein [Gammaproteobacteria bacterium]
MVTNLPSRTVKGTRTYVRKVHDGSLFFYRRAVEGIRRLGTTRGPNNEMELDGAEHLMIPDPVRIGDSWAAEAGTGILERRIRPFEWKLFTPVTPVVRHDSIESVDDTVGVPAGQFERCLRIRSVGSARCDSKARAQGSDIRSEIIDGYAAGVGLIKTLQKEKSKSALLRPDEYLL